MADKINFTQAVIDKLPLPASGRTYYADAKTPGLVLCVWDTGVKSFELYKAHGWSANEIENRQVSGRHRRTGP